MIFLRIVCFSGAVLAALFLPFWFFLLIACVYALLFTSYELLILAVLVDAQFGNREEGIWFIYTLATSIIVILSAYLKPHLRFYK